MNAQASAPRENGESPRYRFTLRQLFGVVTGIALACAAWAPILHMRAPAPWGLLAMLRVCGVASVGLIVGGIVGRPLRALMGALVGVGVAYAACGVFIAGTQMFRMSDAEFLVLVLLCVSLIPAASAAAKRPLPGFLIALAFVPTVVFLFVACSIFYFKVISPPVPGAPPMAYEGREMPMFLAILGLLPGTIVAVCSWIAARAILAKLDLAGNRSGRVPK